MSACLAENIYNGIGNCISLKLYADGEPITHADITRVVVHVQDTEGTVIDSDEQPALFDWTLDDELTLRLGLAAEPLAVGPVSAFLVVYTTAHPSGLRWHDELQLNVEDL